MIIDQAWKAALGQIQMEMPGSAFDTWMKDTTAISLTGSQVKIAAPNAYARDWLDSRMKSTAVRLLTGILDMPVKVEFVVSTRSADEEKDEDIQPERAEAPFIPERPQRNPTLNARYTFENYVVGNNSRLAHAAALAVAAKPARAYNPFFLYGGVGLGKTHLMHAIGNSCHSRGLTVLYVSSEEFTNDMINSIRTHTTQAFREKYRSADVLLIDDIQFIAGKEGTQEEFFHTFNTLHSQDKQIIVSSDRPPKSMVTLEERLRSRFEWGLIADIQTPDEETRQAILRYKASMLGKSVPDPVLDLIAKRVQSNIRELEGALNRVIAFSELTNTPIDARLAEMALVDLLPQVHHISPMKLINLVANEWQITVDEILGRDRSQRIAEPRQVAMYLLRKETNASLPEIGSTLGGRDHTTVMHAINKVTNEILIKKEMERKVNRVKQQLYGQSGLAA